MNVVSQKHIILQLIENTFVLIVVLFPFSLFSQTSFPTTFNSNGTWTAPVGVTSVDVEAWGGGGGGGGGENGSLLSTGDGGGGGGGGGYTKSIGVVVVPGTVYTVGVGTGGGGGTRNNDGNNGGNSFFNTTATVFAAGGTRGREGGNGSGGAGGSSGAGIGNSTKTSGGTGHSTGSSQNGGGGGSSGGTSVNGGNGSSGTGGTVGGGGSGGGDNGAGTSPGGGGGGGDGGGILGGNGSTGGNGGVGRVIVTYYTVPTLVIGNNQVAAANVCPSSIDVPLHSFSITGADNPGAITDISIDLTGTYLAADIDNIKLYYTTTNSFSTANLLATIAAPGAAGNKIFSGFSQPIGNGTYYFWVAMDVSALAAAPRTIAANTTNPANITAAQIPTGSGAASGTQSLGIGAAPAAPVSVAATNVACTSFTANWNVSALTSSYKLDVATDAGFVSMVAGFDNLDVGNVLTYNVTGLSAGTAYFYRVRADKCGAASGNSGTITPTTETEPIAPGNPTPGAPSCTGIELTAAAPAPGGETYYWQEMNAAGTSTTLNATSTYTAVASGTYYIRSQKTGGCWSATSGSVAVVVDAVTPGAIADNQALCGGGDPIAFTETAPATGTGVVYSWEEDDNSSFSSPSVIAGELGITYDPPALAATTWYRRVATVGACVAYSNTLELTLAPSPVITASADVTICVGASTNLTSSGGQGPSTYTWNFGATLNDSTLQNPIATPNVTTTYTVTAYGVTTEKVINGGFETGDNTGFTSDYAYIIDNPGSNTDLPDPNGDLWAEGVYSILSNPNDGHSAFGGAPHSGSKMMVINGAGTPGFNVWCQPFTVAPNQDYAFSSWVTSVEVNSPAQLQFSINGITIGSIFSAPTPVGTWGQFFALWNSALETTANICVVNQNTTGGGNDFGLDDMSFAPWCGGTEEVVVTVKNPSLSSSTATTTICSGSTYSYTLTSASPAPTFSWSRAAVAGITEGASAGGTNTIGETLTNTTAAPIDVTYVIQTTSGGCTGTAESIIVTVNPATTTLNLTSAAGTVNQSICVNTALTDITYSVSGGATGAIVTALPAGLNGSFAAGVFTISGTPTVSGVFDYTVTSTGPCTNAAATGTITVGLSLTTAVGTDVQEVCINDPISNITYAIGGATESASASGLPAGVSDAFVGGVLTISGTPTIAGLYNYTVTTAGVCAVETATGTITVGMGLTTVGTDTQSVCENTTITDIVYSIVGGGVPTVVGLPAGVTVTSAPPLFTINGTPTVAGTYDYTVSTTGACLTQSSLFGQLTVGAGLVAGGGLDTQAVCKNAAIVPIQYKIVGGVGIVTGLPAGINAVLNPTNDTLTISGASASEGTYSYTLNTAGGTCDPNSSLSYGELTIGAGLITSSGNDTQTVCKNSAIIPIQYNVVGALATVTGLPTGITGSMNGTNDTLTITGSSATEGVYNYTLTTSGGTCDPEVSVFFGQLTVGGGLVSAIGTDTQAVCKSAAIVNVQYKILGGIANVTGLPVGITGTLNASNDTLTISGSSVLEGTFNYTVSTAGGTCDPNSSAFYGELTIGAGLISSIGTDTQTVCKNSAITNITYKIVGGVASVSGLPTGVSSNLNATNDTLTIGGTPTVEGTFSYTLSTIGGACDPNSSELYGELTIGGGLISGIGTDTQAVCKNSPIIDIVYKIEGGIAMVAGLPAGVTSNFNASNDTLTISGTPSVEGTFNYSLTTLGGTCGPNSSSLFGELTIGAGLIGSAGTDTQVVCKNSPIAAIVYKIVGGAAIVSGLPTGVSFGMNTTNDTLTISGTSTVEGTFSYTLSTVGGACDPNSSELYGELTIGAGLISGIGTDTQTVCKNSVITDITYKIVGGIATISGLPTGVTSTLNATNDTLTISGTPTIEGHFSYTLSTIGGTCDPNSSMLYGELTVGTGLISGVGSDTQAVCKNSPIMDIRYKIVGGVAAVSGLPIGITYLLNSTNDTLTISGSSATVGTYSYTINTAGGTCDPNSSELYGQLVIGAGLISAVGTDTQAVCKNGPITDIVYRIIGDSVLVTGLPTGIVSVLNSTKDTLTLSGTSAVEGTYNYSVSTIGGNCDPNSSELYGQLIFGEGLVSIIGSDTQSVCKGAPIGEIKYRFVGGVANVYGLPAGIIFSLNASNDTITISGSSMEEGSYNYTVTTAGGACDPIISELYGQLIIGVGLVGNVGTDTQGVCKNDPIIDILYKVQGGAATVTGLPVGITAALNVTNDTLRISGSSASEGTYTYTISTQGGACDPDFSVLYGNLTIGGGLVPVISGGGPDSQSVCKTVAIQDIKYKIVGGMAQVYGLPTGISASLNLTMDTLTISGTSPLAGTYQYTVTTSGGTCDPDSSEFFGQITLDEATSIITSNERTENQVICANTAINDLVFLVGGTGTGATISSLPSGMDTTFVGGSFIVSGTPDLPQGIHDFTVTPTGGVCPSNISEFSLTILNPEARFVNDPEHGSAPLDVNLVNISLNANTYRWSFGDGYSSNVMDTNYIYQTHGKYEIMLIASDSSLCPDTAFASITVYKVEVPNVFSPNGDGVNDIFKVNPLGIKSIDAEIFNRWGKKINEWHIVGGGWDGRNLINNRECEEGTYFYLLKITDLDGISYEEQGSITLLK